MMKRIAAVAAISVAAMQVLAGFTSTAMATHNGPGKHLGNGSNTPVVGASSCTVAAGVAVIQASSGTATVWTDGTYLYCDVNANLGNSEFATAPELADITSAVVYSNGHVAVDLEQAPNTNRPANFGGLRLTVDTAGTLVFDADGLTSYYGGTAVLTDTTFSGQGLVGTIFAALNAKYMGGTGPDSFDASAVTADIIATTGGDGNDVLKSGSGDDNLTAGDGSDKLYAGAGYDILDCDDMDGDADQCWAGAGDDQVAIGEGKPLSNGTMIYDIVAPGDGFDVVTATNGYAANYSDSTVAVEFDGVDVFSDTGDDTLDAKIETFTGSPKGDLLYGFDHLSGGAGPDVINGTSPVGGVGGEDVLSGGGGKDKIRGLDGDDVISGDSGADMVRSGPGNDSVYGGGGDDVLYGLGGVDFLKGGTGIDQTWGGSGIDTCSGEVRDSCEFRKG